MIKQTTAGRRRASAGTPIRTVVFKNVGGLRYTLRVWDTGKLDSRGCSYLSYELSTGFLADRCVLFSGEDFAGSPMHADDADATMKSLLTFLTLRPGDTDPDYFEGYTEPQHSWCIAHAEDLSMAVYERFGE